DEATLAALALFVWHLYNVHLRPSVFPMSWTWLDGRIETHALKEEHALEYEKMFPDKHNGATGKEKETRPRSCARPSFSPGRAAPLRASRRGRLRRRSRWRIASRSAASCPVSPATR